MSDALAPIDYHGRYEASVVRAYRANRRLAVGLDCWSDEISIEAKLKALVAQCDRMAAGLGAQRRTFLDEGLDRADPRVLGVVSRLQRVVKIRDQALRKSDALRRRRIHG